MKLLNRNFSDISPLTYLISRNKEICKRLLRDLFRHNTFAQSLSHERLPYVVSSYSSFLIKEGRGVDPQLQINKVHNIELAAQRIDRLEVAPRETFSFWRCVGNPSLKRGFRDGRVITQGKLRQGVGGGLCNLANTLNLLILNSPLTITELHKHSDALSADGEHRIPFGAGTSVSYNYIDYRFRNDTDQRFQIFMHCDENRLYGELRSESEPPFTYRLIEEDHHFKQVDDSFYRFAKVYRETMLRSTGELVTRELIWDNISRVMFDHDLIPKHLIRS